MATSSPTWSALSCTCTPLSGACCACSRNDAVVLLALSTWGFAKLGRPVRSLGRAASPSTRHTAAMSMVGADGRLSLVCLVCDGREFEQQESRQDSRWGFTSHRMTLMVCMRCRYVMHFHDAHSAFDFD